MKMKTCPVCLWENFPFDTECDRCCHDLIGPNPKPPSNMLMVIFTHEGERYELSFLPSEKATAQAMAQRYLTTVLEIGVLA